MKRTLQYVLYVIGLVSVLVFCVSATVAITDSKNFLGNSFTEPFTMLLLGLGMVGFGTFLKSRLSR